MKKSVFCVFLSTLLLFSALAPAALAAEEAPAEVEDSFVWMEEAAPQELMEDMAETAAELEEEPAWEEPVGEENELAELYEEEPVEEAFFFEDEAALGVREVYEEIAEEAPAEEEGVYVDGLLMDPEDPLYPLHVLQLDGDADDGEYYFSDFTPRPLNDETLRYGIDVSTWQGSINWSKVAASGVEFAFIRCAYRTTRTGEIMKDGRFIDYINGAKAAGLLVGVYIFSQAVTVEEAVEEADFMLDMVAAYDIDLPLVFDLEYYDGGRFNNAELSAREVTDMCLAFCDRVEAAGYVSMVYSNPTMLKKDIFEEELDKLWLANYTQKTSYDAHPYEYWQCTSSGIIDGIDGVVDLDFWFQPKHPGKANIPVSKQFLDVDEDAWYYAPVMAAYKAGVTKGINEDFFFPQGLATRGQAVTMLHRLAGSPDYMTGAAFTDLSAEYYRDSISWAAERGIVNGTSDTTFEPNRAVTREEFTVMLHRMLGSPAAEAALPEYADAALLSDWSAGAMAWAVECGLIEGYEDHTLRPGNALTRAEICTLLMRFDELSA